MRPSELQVPGLRADAHNAQYVEGPYVPALFGAEPGMGV